MSSEKPALTLTQHLRRLFVLALQLFVAAIALWWLLRLLIGDQWTLIRLGSYFAPWLWLSLFPMLLVGLIARSKALSLPALALIAILGWHYVPLFLPKPAPVQADSATSLTVMTFNVHFNNRNADAIAALIAREQPDLIAFQELVPELREPLLSRLVETHPYHTDTNAGSLAVVSRYPLTPQPLPDGVERVIPVTIETPHGLITIWNVHPPPAIFSQSRWQNQQETLAAVANEVRRAEHPVIVLGDFNTTDYADSYRLIAREMTDVHRELGFGFGFTFPEPQFIQQFEPRLEAVKMIGPILRIDYIFVNERLTPQSVRVLDGFYGADHRPVIATLGVANP